ncbi:Flagellar hook-length control protein FliK [Candidatus Nitrotoga sp. BS]|uniref:flagellar hook-length control protein FliK n=1 Tax=Candidatus Nitrotoga sp. BS TaxID=2890408 RepID=UPI001EF3449B|nr:flagellar hook-length control protein FliK [Candidatus Nitrotoga sp. BS]CAH1195886.1 Flagellar hook-length control protein FliK [Candidatus Nitrotoga sp. BS]
MQNIAIPVTSPTVPTLTPKAEGNNTAPTEPFGNVLARQLADSAPLDKSNAPGTGLPVAFATDDLLTTDDSNEEPVELQALTPDDVSTLPNDMLAALLPNIVAAQIEIRRTQPAQPEAVSLNHAQSITTSNVPLKYNESATALEIFNEGNSRKSMTLLTEAQLTPEFTTQLNAPQPNATALVALQASVSNVTNLNSPIPVSINIPVTNQAWADEFSQKIVWVTSQNGQSAELHLNPPQLGPLDVLIKVNGDQATALFTSSHAIVRDAIEQAMPKLREMLADNGIMLGNATVSDHPPREQQTKQTDQQHKREGGQAKIDQTIFVGGTQVRYGHHQGLVDTFA